jgi:hypothetical protein
MKQQFLEVIKDGQIWFEFPSENEDNVREFLMRENLDRICQIRPKVADITIVKKAAEEATTIINLSEPKKVGRPKKLEL